MYFGFTNVITNQNATGPRSAVQQMPLDRILIETDAPHFVPRTLRSDVFGGTTPVSMSHPGKPYFLLCKLKPLYRYGTMCRCRNRPVPDALTRRSHRSDQTKCH